jgi:hypothetical protein
MPKLGVTGRRIKQELYRSLVLLGADSSLLAPVGSLWDSIPESDALDAIEAWNEEHLALLTQRIQHYEIACPQADCSRDESRQIVVPER